MRKIYAACVRLCLTALLSFAFLAGMSQTTLSTTGSFLNNNGSGTVTFNLANTNAYDIIITGVDGIVGTAGAMTAQVWYKTTPVNGAPGAISVANGWTMAASGSFTGVANTSTVTTQVFLTGISFTVPAGTTYGIAVTAFSGTGTATQRYSTISAGTTTISAGGVDLITGTNIGYGGGVPPTAPTNTPRGWIGVLTFEPAVPCTAPPTAGTTTSTETNVCAGANFTLGLTGNSGGTGQTYQWQSSPDNVNWTNISGATGVNHATSQIATTYYRAMVTCSGNTQNSVSIQVTTPSLVSGNYTIDAGIPTGGNNFQTFADAINHIKCGINGPVVFNVVPATYSEQVVIPQIYGTSTVNTIRFKGNLATLSFNSTNTNARAGIHLNGTDHVTIDSLIIDGAAGTYAYGVALTNRADSNTISNCVIINNTNATTTNYIGILINGSAITTGTSGNNGNGNRIVNNSITGGYYGVYLYGNSASAAENNNNLVQGNLVKDFYLYGIYSIYQSEGLIISKNEITRPVRNYTTATTSYGIYVATSTIAALVEKNRIHNLYDAMTTTAGTFYGIYFTSDATAAKPNIIANNLIYNTGGNATVYGIANVGSDHLKVYHNTVALDDGAASTGAAYGLYQTTAATGLDFRNNIVFISRSGTGNKRAIWFNTTTSTIISNNNVLVITSTGGTSNLIGQFGTTTYATLADWKTANSNAYDQVSNGNDPLFMNPSAGEYKPTEAILNNTGANVGIGTDILDSTRNATNPDPGAHEFSGPPCTNPASAGAAIASVTNICANSSFTLDLTGHTTGEGQTYQWQVSPDNVNWTNLSGLTSAPVYTTSQTASSYYRAAVKCNAGATVHSFSVQVTSPAFVSGNFTIDPGMPTGGTNFATFSEAINHIICGVNGPVVFNVAPGSAFTEQVTIPVIPGTSSANTITFNGNLATINFNSTNINARAGITINGADHIIIDSLVIDGSAGTYGWGIQMTNGADSNMVSNCVITVNNTTNTTAYSHLGIALGGTNTTPISASNAGSYNTIINNTITGGYYAVIAYGNSIAPYPTGNNITGNTIKDAYSYNVYVYGNANPVVSKNNISRPVRSASTTTAGLFLTTGVTGALIEKNRIHNLFDALATNTSTVYGIYVSADAPASAPNTIVNNVIYNIGGNGAVYGVYNAGGDSMKVYHNTIALDDQVATTGATYGIYQTTAATGLDYRNNIVFISRSGTGTKRAIWFNTTTSTIVSNNNVLVMTSTGGASNLVGQYGTTTYATLADWKTANANAFDQASADIDPAFNNPATGDYSPTVSGINNIGTNVGVTTDILDNARNATTPDPGAFEFSNLTAGINMRAEALITPAANATGCYTNSETVTIRIRNTSTSTIDFAVNPVTINVNVTGAVTQTLSHTVNSGTLASDVTMDVAMPATLNMTTPGVYTFNANTSLAGDVNTANDAMTPATRTRVALSAGTATGPSAFCVTAPVNPTLSSSGYTGQTSLQWVSSTTQVGGYTAIGGATTVPYTVGSAPTQTMYYKLVAGCGGVTDSSAVVTVTYNNPQVTGTTPGSRCGTGSVPLGATGSAGTTLEWFTAASGGSSIGTGTTFNTPSISTTTSYYVSAGLSGGGNASPLLITELDLGGNDRLEIQNVSPNSVDITGWKVAVGNSYTDINSVNANIQTLSGVMTPGEVKSWTDAAAGPNYWGSNILWNPGAYPTYTGWAAILDNNNNLKDLVFLNWPSANIQGSNIVIGGTPITIGTQWSGNGVDQTTVAATQSVSRQGNSDNNALTDFSIIDLSLGTLNPGMTVPFNGFACNSARSMVTATVNTPASNAAGASGTTECATKTIAGSTDYNFTDCDPIAIIIPSGAAPISGSVNACVTIDASVQTAPTGEPYVQRHYTITPASNPATATSTITLYFLQSEFDAFNVARMFYPALPANSADAAGKANLRITQYNGTGTLPGNYTGTAVQIDPADAGIIWNSTASRWEVTFNATGSGGFYVHTGNFVLPVAGLEFTGVQSGAVNKLTWRTVTETNTKGFELQRSADGSNFSSLVFIASKAENGNSASPLNYNYDDARPIAGSNYYRLKQVDKDGKFTYSNIVLLSRKVTGITLSSVYPNPTERELNLVITSPRAEKVTIIVTDLTGKVVMQYATQLVNGENQQRLDVVKLSAGTYIIKAVCTNGCEAAVHRFVKQ